jgi:membrane-associated phospholipid phosphatase
MARDPRALTLPLIAGLVLLWAAMLVFGGSDPDKAALHALYAGGRPALAAAARAVTFFGSYTALVPATLIGLAILAWRRQGRAALLLLAITLSGRLLVELHKGWVGRVRPEDQEHLVAVQSYAFPSGHAANATIVYLSLALLVPVAARGRRIGVALAAALAVAVGLSRPMLGVHWPSDVIGGWTLGLAWTLLLVRLFGAPPTDCSPASR